MKPAQAITLVTNKSSFLRWFIWDSCLTSNQDSSLPG